ncbi:MAG: helix-turn-helix domain-containing protein, partial [Candidatus Cloacimonadota bacterium]|nr:helix-turn-helix domain-containing protein [Candidatus Cloacimonadota bacterium]
MKEYTIAQVADILKVSEGSVYRYVRKGKLLLSDTNTDTKLISAESLGEFLQGVTQVSDRGVNDALDEADKEFDNSNHLQGVTQVSDRGVTDLITRLDATIEKLESENANLKAEVKSLNEKLY